jgi:hypothetical protein
MPLEKYSMRSSASMLLDMEMTGVAASNWRMRVVASTPSSRGITMSYAHVPRSLQLSGAGTRKASAFYHEHQVVRARAHFTDCLDAVVRDFDRAAKDLRASVRQCPDQTSASAPSLLTCKRRVANCRQISSSSTNSTLGGTDHTGTKVLRTTRSWLPAALLLPPAAPPTSGGRGRTTPT